jgi:hypothetical protein
MRVADAIGSWPAVAAAWIIARVVALVRDRISLSLIATRSTPAAGA